MRTQRERWDEDKPLGGDIDLAHVARRTPGFTGADLANVVNEAALLAMRDGGGPIASSHMSEAIQRVLHGPRRRGQLMSADERRRLAIHESGHALVAAAVGQGDQLDRLSIVARGRSVGQAGGGDDADRVLHTRSQLTAQLAAAMGGIAAEELYCGESSTTAEDDLDKATQLARYMAGMYGMSAGIGRLRLLTRGYGYLEGEANMDIVSGQTMQAFDESVASLLQAAERLATDVLTRHRGELERLAGTLEAEETLEGAALQEHLAAVPAYDVTFSDNGNHPQENTTQGKSRNRATTAAKSTTAAK